jgi:hypothetical protein
VPRRGVRYLANTLHIKRWIKRIPNLGDSSTGDGVVDVAVCVHCRVEKLEDRVVARYVGLDEDGAWW